MVPKEVPFLGNPSESRAFPYDGRPNQDIDRIQVSGNSGWAYFLTVWATPCRETARHLATLMDAGRKFIAYFHSRNESPYHQTVGLTVRVVELDDQEETRPVAA